MKWGWWGKKRGEQRIGKEGPPEADVSPRRRTWPVRTVLLGHSEDLLGFQGLGVSTPRSCLHPQGDPTRVKGLREREGGRQAGEPASHDSQSCCDLLEYQNPSVYEKAGSGAAPRLALVSIKDKQMGCRRTQHREGPPPKKGLPTRGEQGPWGGRGPGHPPSLLKEQRKGGLAAPQLPSPLTPSPQRFERRRGPSEPHASDRPPDSFVTATPARGTSGQPPAPPRPRPPRSRPSTHPAAG